MVEKASYNFERSGNDVEAFEVGFRDKKGQEWSYKANGPITGICMIPYDSENLGTLMFRSIDKKGMVEYSHIFGSDTEASATVDEVKFL